MKSSNGFFLSVTLLTGCFAFGFGDTALAADDAVRLFLKFGSPVAALLGIAGMALAGYLAGRSYDSYTGWERYTHGAGMFFNRKRFRREKPTYAVTDAPKRLDWIDSLAHRMGVIGALMHPSGGASPKWTPDMGMEKLPEPLRQYFQRNPERYGLTLDSFRLVREQAANWEKFKSRFAVADAWSNAWASAFSTDDGRLAFEGIFPPEPTSPPEQWDFRLIRRAEPLPFKSPDHAARLIKKIAHSFGATLVGITRLNPDWVYQGHLRGVGPGPYEVPDHWTYAIVVATPHEWDQMYANPTYGTSYDAYARERRICGHLEVFLQELGYPARAHVPPASYDVVMPPIAIDAGLGEQGRKGLLITPELGSNARLACVTTNVPMTVDKPVDLGIQSFCSKCKICAERCPGGAISHKDTPGVVRGYRRWEIRHEQCFHVWASVATSHVRGCRICLAVCPYTRKNNWIHALSRNIDARDRTGIAARCLLWMQNAFFSYPEAKEFMPPPRGKNTTYQPPPDWLESEKWFDVTQNK